MPAHYPIHLAEEALWLLADKAVYWPARKCLLIADAHFGKASAYRSLGQPVPQGVHSQLFGGLALDVDPAALWDQHLQRVGLITQGCGNAPHNQLGLPLPQAGEGQLQLHAAFVADQFVPFVHYHHAQVRQAGLAVGAGEHQREAFRGGDQGGGQTAGLAGAFAAAGVAGAQADGPGDFQ